VRLTVTDDLRRSRLTVFLRLLLAIPHFIWWWLWTVAALLAAVANWFATLAAGRPPEGLYRFLTAYVRYSAHLYAYVFFAANPYPDFTGDPGYAVDVEFGERESQRRWVTGLRLFLLFRYWTHSVRFPGRPAGSSRTAGSSRRAPRAPRCRASTGGACRPTASGSRRAPAARGGASTRPAARSRTRTRSHRPSVRLRRRARRCGVSSDPREPRMRSRPEGNQ